MTEPTTTIRIEVLRYRPEQEDKPVWQTFDVPFSDDMSVLQGLQQIKDEQDLLIIVSTHGEGDPPPSSVGLFEFLEGPRAPRLEGVRYSVLALGDSTSEKYCDAGKRLDRRMEDLGAERLHETRMLRQIYASAAKSSRRKTSRK